MVSQVYAMIGTGLAGLVILSSFLPLIRDRQLGLGWRLKIFCLAYLPLVALLLATRVGLSAAHEAYAYSDVNGAVVTMVWAGFTSGWIWIFRSIRGVHESRLAFKCRYAPVSVAVNS